MKSEQTIRLTDKDLRHDYTYTALEHLTFSHFHSKNQEIFRQADYVYYEGKKGKTVLKNRRGLCGVIYTFPIRYPTDIHYYL